VASSNKDDLFAAAPHDKGNALPGSMWGQLEEGDYIIIERDGEPTMGGEVEIVSADASVFWVRIDRGRGRIAVHADAGTSVWLPKDLGS
jgi:hypothetical protein